MLWDERWSTGTPSGSGPVPFLAAEFDHCRWPLWKGDEHRLVCGAPKKLGSSYCRAHWRLSGGGMARRR